MEKGDIVYVNVHGEHMYVRLLKEPNTNEDGTVELTYDKSWGLQMGPALGRDGRPVMQKTIISLSDELGTTRSTLYIPPNEISIISELDKNGKIYTQLLSQATGLSLPQ